MNRLYTYLFVFFLARTLSKSETEWWGKKKENKINNKSININSTEKTQQQTREEKQVYIREPEYNAMIFCECMHGVVYDEKNERDANRMNSIWQTKTKDKLKSE